jgi:hypothetical protein
MAPDPAAPRDPDPEIRSALDRLAGPVSPTDTAMALNAVTELGRRRTRRHRIVLAAACVALAALGASLVAVASRPDGSSSVRTVPASESPTTTTWPWVTSTTMALRRTTEDHANAVRRQVDAFLARPENSGSAQSWFTGHVSPDGNLVGADGRPTVVVWLRADGTAVAKRLHDQFGDDVLVMVNRRIYPTGEIGRAMGETTPPADGCGPMRANNGPKGSHTIPVDPSRHALEPFGLQAKARPTEVVAGRNFHTTIEITNDGHQRPRTSIQGAGMLATVEDTHGRTVATYDEATAATVLVKTFQPGTTSKIDVVGATGRCAASGPPTLAPGTYTMRVMLPLISGNHTVVAAVPARLRVIDPPALVSGTLTLTGGPPPGLHQPVHGTVRFVGHDAADPITLETDDHGHFTVALRPGTFQLDGRSPKFGGSTWACHGGTIHVGKQPLENLTVSCPMK